MGSVRISVAFLSLTSRTPGKVWVMVLWIIAMFSHCALPGFLVLPFR